ncbi:MAG: aminomethyltransferase beta-barrel domain-containing protein, partial [Nevskiaceae bacterium]
PRLFSRALVTRPFHWIHRPQPVPGALHARIRHRQALQACQAQALPDGRVRIEFERPQRAAVAGQYAVLYAGEECLGGGEIE